MKTERPKWHTPKEFKDVLFRLQAKVREPQGTTIRVMRVSKSDLGCSGLCDFDRKKREFVIKVARQTTYEEMYDTLIHEYAHVLDHPVGEHPLFEDHGPTWAVWYGRIYQIMAEP